MWCSPGPVPVAIAADATGVTEGKVEMQSRMYVPRSRSSARAGARPSSIASSSISGLSESITASTTFGGLFAATRRLTQDPQARVLLALAPAASQQQHHERHQHEVRDRRQEDRQRREHQCRHLRVYAEQ